MCKRKLLFLIILLIFSFFVINVNADVYNEQLDASGAIQLFDDLPNNVKESLNNLGVVDLDWKNLSNISIDKILSEVTKLSSIYIIKPLRAISVCLGIILLCALMDSFKDSFSSKPLSGLINAVSSLCICISIVNPIVQCLSNAGNVLKYSSTFMLSYIPIISCVMASTGQALSSIAYQTTMMTFNEVLFKLSSEFIIPLVYIILSINIVSSISPRLNLSRIPDVSYKIINKLLVAIVSIFSIILTLQNLISSSADSIGQKAVKAMIGSLIPVVGSAVSGAFSTVYGYVNLLKSSIGAFGIVAILFIFLPILIECSMWSLSLNVCVIIGSIFDLPQVSNMVKGIIKSLNIMIAIIFSSAIIMIISTSLIFISGGMIN